MYCIINQNKDIIAGDKEFFALLNAESLMELYVQIANGDISISFGSDDITIAHLNDAKSYPIRMSELNGLLSQSIIIEILTLDQNDDLNEEIHTEETKSLEYTESTLAQDEAIAYAKPAIEEDKPLEHIELTIGDDEPLENIELTLEENNLISDDVDTELETIQEQTTSIETSKESDYEILGLLDLVDDVNLHENKEPTVVKPIASIEPPVQTISIDIPPIENQVHIDLQQEEIGNSFNDIEIDIPFASQQIGLSADDYRSFLEEYLQASQSLKDDLMGNNEEKKQSAINFIVHLSHVLCLPAYILDVVSKLSLTPTTENIDKYYNTIAKIKEKNESLENTTNEIIDEKEIKIEKEVAPKKVRSIDLSDIEPVKFDFILDEAAQELSLPSDIVKEFISYFIEQSHVEIDNILDAYESNDIEKIKKTAHLLKGVASNLYIVPLADALYELQYNEDIKQVEPLVKKYWAQFISFENLMNNI